MNARERTQINLIMASYVLEEVANSAYLILRTKTLVCIDDELVILRSTNQRIIAETTIQRIRTSAARDAVITQITSRIIIAAERNNRVIASSNFIAIHINVCRCGDAVIACSAGYDAVI